MCHVTLKLALSRSRPSVPYGANLFDLVAGVPQNKAEAVRLYQRAANGGVAAAAERLKALHQHQPRLKCIDKGLYV